MMVQVRTVCSEALQIAENVIHPRVPVIGIEALSRSSIAASHSQADTIDAVPSLFGHQLELGHSDDQSDVEPNQDNVADTSGTELSIDPAVSLSPMESRNTVERLELPAGDVYLLSEQNVTEVVDTAALADISNQNDVTSLPYGQEKLDSISFVQAEASIAESPSSLSSSSKNMLNTVTEGAVADESLITCPVAGPAAAASSGSDTVEDEQLKCSQSELQQSLRKRRYSAASSVNDGDDSESESGEIEVWREFWFHFLFILSHCYHFH